MEGDGARVYYYKVRPTLSVTVSEISAAFWPARLVNFHPTSATLLLRPEAEDRLKFEMLEVMPPRPKSWVENDLGGG